VAAINRTSWIPQCVKNVFWELAETVANTPYETKPYEEINHNVFNGINALVQDDFSSAAVEYKQFHVQYDYWAQKNEPCIQNQLGFYLSCLAHQKIRDNGTIDGFKLVTEAKKGISIPEEWFQLSDKSDRGDVLVLIYEGKAPRREPANRRMTEAEFAAELAQYKGKVLPPLVMFPKLEPRTATHQGVAGVQLDEHSGPFLKLLDLGSQVATRFKVEEPTVMERAVRRAAVRAQVAYDDIQYDKKAPQLRGTKKLASDIPDFPMTQADMEKADRDATDMARDDIPDTRGWSLLPNDVIVCKAQLAPGTHKVRVQFQDGYTVEKTVEVKGCALVTALFIEP